MSSPAPPHPILRFAPSPNGRLHLGHAYSALVGWHAARAAGGTWLLRIEDIDPVRSRPEFVAGIEDDLTWLGLDWPRPVLQQSQRLELYANAAGVLRDRTFLYACFCSRKSVAEQADGRDPDGAPLYPGTCRHRPADEVVARLAQGEPVQWRLAMDRAIRSTGPLRIDFIPGFERHGRLEAHASRPADPARWGDVVLVRKDVPTSYHLSVVIDDADQGISHVVRGQDLEAATDLHVLLQALLGLPHPVYAHHRLLVDSSGEKLAKSRGSQSLSGLRAAGWTPEDVRRQLGFSAESVPPSP
ncbi:glutamyl-Q tRNA(Asp) synthetase [Devosia enhydra]|uniref:Glutamyl-Q tRNA(Asp) synthetase n=1 Tax=Devosia enhydra TaxID=665118 RepID=A0A1K2I1U2_9HYPH|nr:tRNA glutamyl-Q(34) synthetase GluQRS [Devosia enhydra]SFZ85724.1 glutamyl-Q tRNA(Asp) synthetase [Devosia enhydra]